MAKQKERYTLSLFKRLNIFITMIITKFINSFNELLIRIQACFFKESFRKTPNYASLTTLKPLTVWSQQTMENS